MTLQAGGRGRERVLIIITMLVALLLSSCMLSSGERTSADAQAAGGNMITTFISAEGSDERTLATGGGTATLNVITIVEVEQGELRLELLNPEGSVALTIQGRPGEQITRSGNVPTDSQGNLRYRVTTRGARNGGFQVLYQR